MRFSRSPLLAGLLALVLAACGGEDRSEFVVDPNLLGPVAADSVLGLSLRAPFQFQQAGPSWVESARQALSLAPGADGPFFTMPRAVFAVPRSDARILVGEFPNAAAGALTPAWRDGYLAAAREKAGSAGLEAREIDLNDRPALLVRIDNRLFRNDRIVLETPRGRLVQVDYVVPNDLLDELGAGVESSIGSIRTF